jgi:hypothetical protein
MLGPSNEEPTADRALHQDRSRRPRLLHDRDDKIATLANPDEVSQIGVYRLTEIREGKRCAARSTLGLYHRHWAQPAAASLAARSPQACRRHERAASGIGRSKDWLTASVRAFLRPLRGRVGRPCDRAVRRNPPAQNSVPLGAPVGLVYGRVEEAGGQNVDILPPVNAAFY